MAIPRARLPHEMVTFVSTVCLCSADRLLLENHLPPAISQALALRDLQDHTRMYVCMSFGFRYVVGIQDGNVDPVKCGQMGAEEPAMLTRQVSTDGIVLQPPSPPPPEDPEQGTRPFLREVARYSNVERVEKFGPGLVFFAGS